MTIMEAGGYKIHIASDEAALCDALALRLVELAQQFIESDGIFTLLLSGGSTPRGLYSALARMPKGVVPWDKIYLFLGD
jgi:6-phosphogluconolactonase